MSKEHLANYLNDHLAGSVAALEIVAHLEAEAPELTPDLAGLRTDIQADRQELAALMDRLGISESRIRKAGGWLAEKLTEFKLDVDDPSDGALRRFESLETLALRIDGKRALWRALSAAAESAAELRGLDYARLMQRAEEQRSRVEVFRLQEARSALGAYPL